MKKVTKIVIFLLVTVYILFGFLIFIYQRSYIYYPNKQDFNLCPNFADAEKIIIKGTRIYFKRNSDKLIIFYHGNAGSACDRKFIKDHLEKLGFSYIFVEYAGYSNDKEKPAQKLLMKDVENVNYFLENREFNSIVIMGESLGSSLALYHSSLAKENKLLLISPFFTLSNLAKKVFPFYPISLMLLDNYDNTKWMEGVNNVLIIHGNIDNIIPISESKKLFDKIRAKSKQFIEISGGNHNDIYSFDRTWSAIDNYLK